MPERLGANGRGNLSAALRPSDVTQSAAWIAAQQGSDGAIPWYVGGKLDPWDHVHAAMGLTVAGRTQEALAAFRYLARTQYEDGGFEAARLDGVVTDLTRESNHAAYFATGLWHLFCAKPEIDILAELWPTVDRAVDFVVQLQEPSGAIAWAVNPEGVPWHAPLLTGSSSIHGSLVCALRIAAVLGIERAAWHTALLRLNKVLRGDHRCFEDVDLPEPSGRHSMDWYYPVMAGAVRGKAGRARLGNWRLRSAFLTEGVGCRCVRDRPWYTVAETCELVLALEAVGWRRRAEAIFSWMERLRGANGAYWTGETHPDGIRWPEGEQTTWTTATVLLAHDALYGESPTSSFFRDLADDAWLPNVEAEADEPAGSAAPAEVAWAGRAASGPGAVEGV